MTIAPDSPERVNAVDTSSPAAEPWALRMAAWVIVVGAFLTGTAIVVGIVGANWWANEDVDGADRSTAEAEIRDTALRIATGFAATTAGVLAWGRLELSRREHRLAAQAEARSAEAQAIAVDGQVTDRYIRAVEQLGSPDVAVRLGALYALERLARDSTTDRVSIYEVICAYVRHHSTLDDGETKVDGLAVDYRAALQIVLRRPEPVDEPSDLRGAVLVDDHGLFGMILNDVMLREAHLDELSFYDVDVHDIDLFYAEATGVNFTKVSLQNVFANHAQLTHVVFENCRLHDVTLTHAHLCEVGFGSGTVLEDVRFDGATLSKVTIADDATMLNVSFAGAEFVHVHLPPTIELGPGYSRAECGGWWSTTAAQRAHPSYGTTDDADAARIETEDR